MLHIGTGADVNDFVMAKRWSQKETLVVTSVSHVKCYNLYDDVWDSQLGHHEDMLTIRSENVN